MPSRLEEREPDALEAGPQSPPPAHDALEPARSPSSAGALPLHSSAAGVRRQAVLALQHGRGNAWVARQLARQGDPARDAFVGRGVMPGPAGVDTTSATTGIGGFNAKYDPAAEVLTITLRVGIDFLDALTADPLTGVVLPATPDFAADALVAMANPDQAARVAEVQSNWNWSAGQRRDWLTDYEALAEGAWGQRHHFVSDRWDDLFADVHVDLQVHAGHLATDHCQATVFKVPEGSPAGPGAVVNSTGSPTANTGTFTSAHLGATGDFLNYRLEFPEGGAAVAGATGAGTVGAGDAGPAFLNKFIADFQRGTPTGGAPVRVVGHASATGSPEANRRIARRRAENVAQYLRTHGDRIASSRITVESVGADGATADAEWRRVDIVVGDGQAQVTMAHETGHMLGLDDEYSSPAGGFAPGAGSGGDIGDPTGHNPLGGGTGGSVYENNDNIMSVGNVVRPQHYSTFHEALTLVAAPETWHYGGRGNHPTPIPDLFGPHVEPPDAVPV